MEHPRSRSRVDSVLEYAEVSSRGQILRGFVHLPAERSGPVPLVMLWHGFSGTKVEPHRVLVGMAQRLARAGIAAARFDFWGSGDSDGDFQDMTPQSEIEDAQAVLAWARAQDRFDSERLGLLGLSLGGWVSACTAGRDGNIKALCLWAATVRFASRIEANLTSEQRAQIETHGWWDMSGNRIGKSFLEVGAQINSLQELRGHCGAALVVHSTRDMTVPLEEGEAYARALKCALHVIEEGDHTFNRVAWEDELFEVSEEFFRREMA